MEIIYGNEIEKYITDLGEFRIKIFKEYPYLYDGNLNYEKKYLSRYSKSKNSILLLIRDEIGIVGACTGIALKDEDEEFKRPFLEKNLNIDEFFYIGEIMIRDDFRDKKVGTNLLQNMISLIDSKIYKKVLLCTVDRKDSSYLPPNNYFSPDKLWIKFGFEKDDKMIVFYRWRDIGNEMETEKPMNIWFKNIF